MSSFVDGYNWKVEIQIHLKVQCLAEIDSVALYRKGSINHKFQLDF